LDFALEKFIWINPKSIDSGALVVGFGVRNASDAELKATKAAIPSSNFRGGGSGGEEFDMRSLTWYFSPD
jgi:hypothetical protein